MQFILIVQEVNLTADGNDLKHHHLLGGFIVKQGGLLSVATM